MVRVSLTKNVDSASPALAALCAAGNGPADPLRIEFSIVGGNFVLVPPMIVDLRTVRVEQFLTGFRAFGGTPVEELSFSYGEMSVRVITYEPNTSIVIDNKAYKLSTPK